LFKEDTISTGEEKVTYISVELDQVDLQDNKVFDITVRYGKDANSKFNSLTKEIPFRSEGGSPLTGFAVFGGGESGSIIVIIIVIIVVGLGFFLIRRRR
jgi:LPXTG-motif cell wall-anchored protein